MRTFRLFRSLQCATFLVMVLISVKAFAVQDWCHGPLPILVNLPSVSVPKNLAIGQRIPGASASFAVSIKCDSGFAAGKRRWLKDNSSASYTLVPGFSDVYTLPGMIAGIGFRLRGSGGAVLVPFNYAGTTNAFDLGAAVTGVDNVLQGTLELVKTSATVELGTFSFSGYASVDGVVYANGGTKPLSSFTFQYTIVASAVPACTVTQSDIAVTLFPVPVRDLPTVGATTGARTFNLSLMCEDNVKPQITVTDVANPSNQSAELSLAPGSTAKGVAVQILYGTTLIHYGPALNSYTNATSSTNGIAFTVGSGNVQVPFSARYVRVGDPLTPGVVKAMATFSLSYQ
jgi:type 1 fimbria pilin